MPNMHSPEQFLVEHVRGRQREVEEQHRLARLRTARPGQMRRMVGGLGTLLVILVPRMKRFEQRGERSV